MLNTRSNTSNHNSLAVSAQWIFEESSQFAISIRNIVLLLFRMVLMQSIYTVAQSQQWLIDVGALYHSHTSVLGAWGPFTPRQIDQAQLANVQLALNSRMPFSELGRYLHDGVRARWCRICACGLDGSPLIALQQQWQDFLNGNDHFFCYVRYDDAFDRVLPKFMIVKLLLGVFLIFSALNGLVSY